MILIGEDKFREVCSHSRPAPTSERHAESQNTGPKNVAGASDH